MAPIIDIRSDSINMFRQVQMNNYSIHHLFFSKEGWKGLETILPPIANVWHWNVAYLLAMIDVLITEIIDSFQCILKDADKGK